MPKQHPKDFRDRVVRLVNESRENYETEWGAIQVVAGRLNMGAETLRKWMHRSEIDACARPGVSSVDQTEIRRLKKEVAELRGANGILRTASAFFAAELDRLRALDV